MDNSKLKVCDNQCNECLFSSNKIVPDARRKQILNTCQRNGTYFVCHKATLVNETVVCRGYYDTYGPQNNLIRVMRRIGGIEFVDVEALTKKSDVAQ